MKIDVWGFSNDDFYLRLKNFKLTY